MYLLINNDLDACSFSRTCVFFICLFIVSRLLKHYDRIQREVIIC